jgi:hypothetical protein
VGLQRQWRRPTHQNTLWFYGGLRTSGFDRDILNAFNADGLGDAGQHELNYRSAKLAYQANQCESLLGLLPLTRWSSAAAAATSSPDRIAQRLLGSDYARRGLVADRRAETRLVGSLQFGSGIRMPSTTPTRLRRSRQAQGHDDRHLHAGVTGDSLNDGTLLLSVAPPREGRADLLQIELCSPAHQFKVGFDFLASSFNHEPGVASGPATTGCGSTTGAPFQIETLNYPSSP